MHLHYITYEASPNTRIPGPWVMKSKTSRFLTLQILHTTFGNIGPIVLEKKILTKDRQS